MKKSLIALAVTSAVAAPAFAQSSVTLYGIIDTGITYVNNTGGAHQFKMSSGVIQGSRWGLKGTEDLGGGTKAIFQLENGFNVGTGTLGQGSREFGRQAYVGLTNNTYGTLTLGRQYDPVVDNAQPTTFNGQWGAYFSHPADIDNTDNGFRINNAVKYVSPRFYGVQAEGMYAFGGQAGSFSTNSTVGGGLNYSAGPLYIGAGYFFAKNPGTQFNDGNFIANQAHPATPNPLNGIWGLVGQPTSEQSISVGGTYTIGAAQLGLNWSNVRFENSNGVAGNTVYFNSAEIWGNYHISPALTGGLGYTYTQGKVDLTDKKPKYGQLNAIIDYALSKRTDVSLMGIYQHAMSGGVTADIYAAQFAGSAGASSNTNQVAVRVGIRHKF
ncbi:porin [Trinickia violacea]|uniref:Porin n=1 Tax=Trinickia violacea TaxID=2571746 RepID=A0A4P8IXN3_9BURK|nr:porin [Trinickia violacea]QCP50659.1 porin [Trinickia violacea]